MAYATGSAGSITALLDNLKTFAVANGWKLVEDGSYTLQFASSTVSHSNQYSINPYSAFESQAISAGYSSASAKRVVLQKNGVYFQVFGYLQKGYKNRVLGDYAWIEVWIADSHTTGAGNAHLGTNLRKQATVGNMTQSFSAYHIFSAGDYLHMVIEETAGQFRHLSFGFLTKYGTFTGGQYACSQTWYEHNSIAGDWNDYRAYLPFGGAGSYISNDLLPRGAFRADIDGATNRWINHAAYSSESGVTGGTFGLATYANHQNRRALKTANNIPLGLLDVFYDLAPQTWNGVTPLASLYATATRGGSDYNWSLLGEYPDVRYLNITNYAAGNEITLGTEVWKVFPIFSKQYATGPYALSYDHGLAYRKVT